MVQGLYCNPHTLPTIDTNPQAMTSLLINSFRYFSGNHSKALPLLPVSCSGASEKQSRVTERVAGRGPTCHDGTGLESMHVLGTYINHLFSSALPYSILYFAFIHLYPTTRPR